MSICRLCSLFCFWRLSIGFFMCRFIAMSLRFITPFISFILQLILTFVQLFYIFVCMLSLLIKNNQVTKRLYITFLSIKTVCFLLQIQTYKTKCVSYLCMSVMDCDVKYTIKKSLLYKQTTGQWLPDK